MLAAPLALIVAMFSLQEVPKPLEAELPPDAFDSEAASALAFELAAQFPEPRPGSEAGEGLAEFVSARFQEIPSAEVAEQSFEGSFDDQDVPMRNLIVTLPGRSERQIAVVAQRDAAEGSGAATSIASTAVLLEILSGFSGASHEKTLVFVSTDGGSAGALGARRFSADYTEKSLLDAAIVVSQPAAPEPSPPFEIPWSTGPQSTSAALAVTGNATLSEEAGEPAGDAGPLSDLMRLALPSGLGEQGPLIESGLDSVRVSSSGELPLDPVEDQADEVNPRSLGTFGRATLSLMLALDAARGPIEHGPDAYVGLAGNLLPGWSLALLALALLAPVGLVCGLAIAAAARSPAQAARGLGWAALRAIPFLLSLATIYLFAFVGLIPSPAFPFDPAGEGLGRGGVIGVMMALVVLAAVAFLLRPLLAPPASLARVAGPAALGLAALVTLGVWFINPYLSLLIALGLQLWVPAAAGVTPGRLAAAGLVAAGSLPALLAVVDLASRFDAGPGIVWDMLLMFTGGQISDLLAVLWCMLAGAGLAVIASASREPAGDEPQLKLGALVERGRALEERRGRGRERRPRRERLEPAQPEPESEPEPGPDPRMWSKPAGSTSSPSPSRISTPSPWEARPT